MEIATVSVGPVEHRRDGKTLRGERIAHEAQKIR